jgi:trehalose synthase
MKRSGGREGATLLEVDVPSLPPERLVSVLSRAQAEQFQEVIAAAKRRFAGVTIWNVNSTARGGGVAEMLRSLIGYVHGAGLDARWLVIPGNAEFFRVTKRIHNHLHGSPGDGGVLDAAARGAYEATLAPDAGQLAQRVRRGDLVLLHDPQTAGLVGPLKRHGAHVVWRCHVGIDMPNALARTAWDFLLPYVREADAYVFSRLDFAWEGLERGRVWVIPPSIDAFSTKNREMTPTSVRSVLSAAGVLGVPSERRAEFTREDGSTGHISNRARMVEMAPAPDDAALVAQVSRWDRLKDPTGVIAGFAEFVAPSTEAHLIVAGPAVEAVADDPEGLEVLSDCTTAWSRLPEPVKKRIHLAALPMHDGEENAAIVNALQRRANIVVQKSLAEGFGLTVAEAMWKGRPVVASRIGGIQNQIEHGRTGLLLDDPTDLETFGALLRDLLGHPADAEAMGRRAQEEVRDHFLGPRHLMQYARLMTELLDAGSDR